MSIGIWNNIDELGLYLGLSRLDGETNDDFAYRLRVFPKWKFKTDYYSQVHSIPLQLGLNTEILSRITNNNGNNFECSIDWDYFILREVLSDGTTGNYLRYFIGGNGDTDSLNNAIESLPNFAITSFSTENLPFSYLVRNSNVKIENQLLDGVYSTLDHKNLVRGSVRINDKSYRRLVDSIDKLKRPGEFYVDYKEGFIQTFDLSPNKASITYSYYDPTFCLEITELNLIPINQLFKYGITDDSIKVIPFLLNNIIAGE